MSRPNEYKKISAPVYEQIKFSFMNLFSVNGFVSMNMELNVPLLTLNNCLNSSYFPNDAVFVTIRRLGHGAALSTA